MSWLHRNCIRIPEKVIGRKSPQPIPAHWACIGIRQAWGWTAWPDGCSVWVQDTWGYGYEHRLRDGIVMTTTSCSALWSISVTRIFGLACGLVRVMR
jgi:hypothetical protein